MALDEPKEEDTVFVEEGVTYMVDKELLERVKPIKVEYVHSPMGAGFHISSNLKQSQSCGSCSC